ncbi:hypothetical protein SODG_002443 [Sodalis praecaptivus]
MGGFHNQAGQPLQSRQRKAIRRPGYADRGENLAIGAAHGAPTQ